MVHLKNFSFFALKLLVTLALLGVFACSKVTPSTETNPYSPDSSSEGLPHPFYPHSDDWGYAQVHGAWVQSYGKDQCSGCHDIEGTSGPNACKACHPYYPKTDTWLEDHRQEDPSGCATLCHGYDLSGGLSGVSCSQCHEAFPHEDGWDTSHGNYVVDNDALDVCLRCHDDDSFSGVTCDQCHLFHLENEDYADSNEHPSDVSQSGLSSCQFCHGSDYLGGDTGVSCYKCHTNFPHSSSWSSATNHGATVIASGSSGCQSCHGSDFAGGTSGTSCYTCHNYPHADGWDAQTAHGAAALPDITACGKNGYCHGSDYQGGNTNVSCYTCHPLFPHTSDYADPTKHGDDARTAITVCTLCHGSDYLGGNTGKDCYTCHGGIYPHPSGWSSGHGDSFTEALCYTSCHGSDGSGGNSGVNCNTCHVHAHSGEAGDNWVDPTAGTEFHGAVAEGNSTFCLTCHTTSECSTCHSLYPHSWETTHGQYVLGLEATDKLSVCATNCHGNTLSGGLTETACNSCHPVYPHSSTYFPNYSDWNSIDQHGAYGSELYYSSLCEDCHKSDHLGGNTGVSCTTCHPPYPHTWADDGTDLVHATSWMADPTACTGCHGTDGTRETSGGVKCTDCHTSGITHGSGWSQGSGHGVYYSTNFEADSADQTCKNCHGAPVNYTDNEINEFEAGDYDCMLCHYDMFHSDSVTTDQTAETLASESSCYGCHLAYPHLGYNGYEDGGSIEWRVPEDLDAHLDLPNQGHVVYRKRHDTYVDAPTTCGGSSENNCHYNGYRADNSSALANDLCGEYCHRCNPGVDVNDLVTCPIP